MPMKSALTYSLTAVLLACLTTAAPAQTPAPKDEANRQEWEQLRKQFSDPRSANLLGGAMWTLTHDYESKDEVDKVLKLLGLLGDSLAKQDPAPLDGVGGARGFKDSVAAFLDSGDDTVAGFAATVLAACGDARYTHSVARLLEKTDRKEGDAAKALAIMGAEEYKARIARLLDDESELVRADALLALGVLNAREYIPRIARFLKDPSYVSNFAAEALVLMGADEYARECVPLVESAYSNNLYLGADQFHPLAEGHLGKYRSRFAASFLRMKALLSK
jgi:hypothetical protein